MTRCLRIGFPLTVACAAVLLAPVSARAGGWTELDGGDHGGEAWTPDDGAFIAGQHTNIGEFVIEAGTTVFVHGRPDPG